MDDIFLTFDRDKLKILKDFSDSQKLGFENQVFGTFNERFGRPPVTQSEEDRTSYLTMLQAAVNDFTYSRERFKHEEDAILWKVRGSDKNQIKTAALTAFEMHFERSPAIESKGDRISYLAMLKAAVNRHNAPRIEGKWQKHRSSQRSDFTDTAAIDASAINTSAESDKNFGDPVRLQTQSLEHRHSSHHRRR